MKKNFKNLFALVLSIMATMVAVSTVKAEEIPQTFTATTTANYNAPIAGATGGTIKNFKTPAGKYVYCTEFPKYAPIPSVVYTKGALVTDNGMNYILNKAYGAKDDNENFIYSNALWLYLLDKGMTTDYAGQLAQVRARVNSDNSAAATQIKQLIEEAKKAGANDTAAPTISINASSANFTLSSDKKYYVSNGITVTSSTNAYEVSLTSAPEGTTIAKDGNKVTVKVPADKVTTSGVNVSFKVSTSKSVYTSYVYTANNSAYQSLAATYKETKGAENTATVNLNKKVGGVSISKQDITNKEELPGATLVIRDVDGNEIDRWVSTNEPHIINELEPGVYTLTEVIAPEGYVLSTETISFTVKDDGSITKVVMYNSPDTKDVPTPKPVEVPVENTASFKTVTSSLIGTAVILIGGMMIFKNSKKKENN